MSAKARAAAHALDLVRAGMTIGLGSGSTAEIFVRGLAERVRQGLAVSGVPTSRATEMLARSLGLPLLDDLDGPVDLAIDGADEIDPQLNLVKGRGGAMVREKIVARAARRLVIIADESKLVDRLGRGPLPVEVLPFLWSTTGAQLDALGARATVRESGRERFVTDNGNFIFDCTFPTGIRDPHGLAAALSLIPGVVGHGLFLGLAAAAIVGREDGVRILGAL
jgi:ribose 5-phosphate isomerase A